MPDKTKNWRYTVQKTEGKEVITEQIPVTYRVKMYGYTKDKQVLQLEEDMSHGAGIPSELSQMDY